MSENHKCEICKYETPYKQNLMLHLKSKKHLNKINGIVIEKNQTFKCTFENCNYETNKNFNYDRHVKSVHFNKKFIFRTL